jgi:hypothetical protein
MAISIQSISRVLQAKLRPLKGTEIPPHLFLPIILGNNAETLQNEPNRSTSKHYSSDKIEKHGTV